jgi:hypothetical protein
LSLVDKAQGKTKSGDARHGGDKGENSKINKKCAHGRSAMRGPRESAAPRSARC